MSKKKQGSNKSLIRVSLRSRCLDEQTKERIKQEEEDIFANEPAVKRLLGKEREKLNRNHKTEIEWQELLIISI